MTTTDLEALTRRALAGDAAAFGRLIRHYDRDLRGVVWAVVRNAPDTDDVMQIAEEKAFRSLVLPESGVYQIVVSGIRGNVGYTLDVDIR